MRDPAQNEMQDENRITYFAETDARNKKVPFGIKTKDRSRHIYIIGKTGMGKSTVLENMAIQDIQNGEGMAFVDPHGKTADLLLDYVPKERIKDIIYFAPFDTEHPISFNVMEDVGADKRHLVSNGLMSAFKKIWIDAWSARMEYILNNTLLALLEYPNSTLIGVNRMLADKDYRKKVVENISDPSVKSFWTDEFAKYGEKYMQEAGAAIQNKIGQFIANPLVRNIIGQPKSTFNLRKVMDEKKIIIINLSKGRVGEMNANLLGSMLITKIYLAAMSRADVTDTMLGKLPQFYLYVDEFQSFANESFADILSEARKYKLSLTIAHQYIEQMSEEVRAAVFGNVGTMITFRVGAYDAEVLEKEFAPTFDIEDLVNLGFVQIYLKLMIDGVSSPPFSASTLSPIKRADITYKDDIIESSRRQFSRSRQDVEDEIRKWHEPINKPFYRRDERDEERRDTRKTNAPMPVPAGAFVPPERVERFKASNEQRKTPRDTRKALKDEILRTASPANQPQPPISLETLKKQTQPKKDNKNPSKENLSELKAALASVMDKNKEEKIAESQKMESQSRIVPEAEKKEPDKRKTEPKTQVSELKIEKKENFNEKKNSGKSGQGRPKEIPEEVLRKILDVPK